MEQVTRGWEVEVKSESKPHRHPAVGCSSRALSPVPRERSSTTSRSLFRTTSSQRQEDRRGRPVSHFKTSGVPEVNVVATKYAPLVYESGCNTVFVSYETLAYGCPPGKSYTAHPNIHIKHCTTQQRNDIHTDAMLRSHTQTGRNHQE